MIWPTERIYIWAILPVPAWLLATLLVGGSLWAGLTGAQAGVAHFAHLGGLAFGFSYLKIRDWRRGAGRREFQKKLADAQGGGTGIIKDRTAVKRWESIDVASLHELNREEVEQLLRKVREEGPRALTSEERQFLDRMVASSGTS